MKVDKLVPEIYYKGSRDFGAIGRLCEVLLNYIRLGSNIVGSNLNYADIDSNLLELVCNTLGFIVKHKYITKDLLYISNVFTKLIKNKGTEQAIKLAISTLLASQNINNRFEINVDTETIKKNEFEIVLPEEINDLVLLEDIFDYILPVGCLYKFSFRHEKPAILTEIKVKESPIIRRYGNADVTEFTNNPSFDENLGRIYETKIIDKKDSQITEGYIITEGDNPEKALGYLGTIVTGTSTSEQNNT